MLTRITTIAAAAIFTTASASAMNVVTVDNLSLHTAPDASARIITVIPEAAPIRLGECTEGNWCAVNYRNVSGYAFIERIDHEIDISDITEEETVVVNVDAGDIIKVSELPNARLIRIQVNGRGGLFGGGAAFLEQDTDRKIHIVKK